ncbi:hypothetical protein MPSEU_000646900 [Mayamaea pseudoterrestris]|nr:hypothetical protein MPSEU_000646900 [Mayamaea pseudoterrestris]
MSFTVRPIQSRTQQNRLAHQPQVSSTQFIPRRHDSHDNNNLATSNEQLGSGQHASELVRRQRLAALGASPIDNNDTRSNARTGAMTAASNCISSESGNDDEDEDDRALQDYYLHDHNIARPALVKRRRNKRNGKRPLAAGVTSTGSQSCDALFLEFQIATWNVLFEPIHVSIRMKEICRQVLEIPRMLFVGYQECTDEIAVLLKREMEAAGYATILQPLRAEPLPIDTIATSSDKKRLSSLLQSRPSPSFFSDAGFGCMLCIRQLSKDPVLVRSGFYPYVYTYQSRGFCYAVCRLPNRVEEILVATTHMESIGRASDGGNSGSAQRAAQLLEFVAFAEQAMAENNNLHWALFTGDMNWNDVGRDAVDPPMEQVLSGKCSLVWKDTWLETKPDDPKATCYTYDGLRNPMRNNQWRSRLDRTLLFARNDGTADKQLLCLGTNSDKLLGTRTLMGNANNCCLTFLKPGGNESAVAPSDHFGFVSRLGFEFDDS